MQFRQTGEHCLLYTFLTADYRPVMPSPFDPSDFEDHEYKPSSETHFQGGTTSQTGGTLPQRPPTREEVDNQVGEMQKRISDLHRQQEKLERERANLEETRRRQLEFENSRTELVDQLTRGVGVLEEEEIDSRRALDALSSAHADLKLALEKVLALREENWTSENFQMELNRALTTLDNARMEWNSVRVKYPSVERTPEEAETAAHEASRQNNPFLQPQDWPQLFRLGIALTWPLVLLGLGMFVTMLIMLRR